MNEKKVVVYISEDSSKCNQLLFELDKLDVNYEIKNVTKNKDFMKELQNEGVYGTPATFIGNNNTPILGVQKNKIKQTLVEGELGWNHYF
ncbi:glutaredoxin family protein [Virgibacillus oceani]